MPWGIPTIWATAAAIVVIIAAIFYGIYRLGIIDRDDGDGPPDGTDLVDRAEEGPEEYRIPLRDKQRQLPPMMKMSIVAILLAMGVIGYYAYLFLRSGNPVEIKYAGQMEAAAVIAVSILAGVQVSNRLEERLGILYIDFEKQESSELERTEKIYFDVERSERDDDGNIIVQELFPRAILGLFHRRKLAGHDKKLRSRRPLGDYVRHMVPRHAVSLDGERVILLRTQRRKLIESPTGPADYTYRPPVRLPYRTYLNQQREMFQMKHEMDHLKSKLASVEEMLQDAERDIRNQEYQTREDFMETLGDLSEILHNREQHVTIQRENGLRRLSENGQDKQQAQERGAADGGKL